MARRKDYDNKSHLTLQEGEEVGVKAFNKAIADLELLSNYERLAFINRGQRNYRGWIDVLQSWINKLSPDISEEELYEMDINLRNCKKMISGTIKNFAMSDVEETLDDVERKLFKYQQKLGIDNPNKREDSFFKTEEEW